MVITTKVDLRPNPHKQYPNITVFGCYADGYACGEYLCTSFQLPGMSTHDAIEAAKLEYFELYGVYPTYISVKPITHITMH